MNSKHPTKPRPGPTIVCAALTLAFLGLFALAQYTDTPWWVRLFLSGTTIAFGVLTGSVFESYRQDVRRRQAYDRGDAPWQNRGY